VCINRSDRERLRAYAGFVVFEGRLDAANAKQTTAATRNTTPIEKMPRTPIGRNNRAATSNSIRRRAGRTTAPMTASSPRATPAHSATPTTVPHSERNVSMFSPKPIPCFER
jgi:hypothetical protein